MDKKYFTKEQLERLSVAEEYFSTAVNANYKRGTSREMSDMLADIYEQATGEKLNRNWTCNNCCLNNYKTIGTLYFESKERLLNQEQDTQETTVPDDTQEVQMEFDFEGENNTVQETTNQEQDTQETTVPADTQKVQEETEVTNPEVVGSEPEPISVESTPEETVTKKGRPKKSK